ncbi:MAG: outer membrane protein assembly factor BamC [Methylobacillus sp.]|jgi:outer membrane protein assembly factor BamC|nr:outer membrane protein assembly factor BamC [Methylobacillus sp.]
MSKFKTRTLIVSILAVITLVGCDSIPFIGGDSEDNDYKSAGRSRPLEVPPDLTTSTSSDLYSVPGATTYSQYSEGKGQQEDESQKILPTPDSVRMERAGSERWLVVKAPPEKVWPVVRDFWNELGFAVRTEDTQTGVMETEWVDPSKLTEDKNKGYLDKFQSWLDKLNTLNNRQKFRTRLDRGGEEGTTEIYLSHRTVSNSALDDGKERTLTSVGVVETGYRSESKNKELEAERANAADIDAELLRRLMVRLGIEEKKSHTIMAAATNEQHATFEPPQAGKTTQARLIANDPFDRAWRRVSLALDRIGFAIEDRDRSRGIFYIRYSAISEDDPNADPKKKGWLSSLKFWGDDEEDEAKNAADGKAKSSDGKGQRQYLIQISRGGDTSQITVIDANGQIDPSPTANRILAMLYDHLK